MEDVITEATTHPLVYYRNQLEFNGYRVEEDGTGIIARHPRKAPIQIRPLASRGGVLAAVFYTPYPTVERTQLLEYANDLNTDFVSLKAYLTEAHTLFMEAFLEGEYDKTNFSVFLENIDKDMVFFWQHELTLTYLQ